MKSHSILLLLLLSLLTFSCTDNLTDIGMKIQPAMDDITLGTDTFHVKTENVFVDSIFAKQDSFLLGTFYDLKYGSTRADILAQVNCPINYKFPPGSVADSVLVVLGYTTWFGDSYSPMNVSIYEMNKTTFNYSSLYPTNLNPNDYSDKSNLLGHRIFSAKDASKARTDTTSIIFKLSNSFRDRFFNINSDTYSSQSKFTDFFKGMYITTDFGVATMLNVKQIDLELYYHYNHIVKSSTGADSTVTTSYIIPYPANAEVRQVNRFLHPEADAVKAQLSLNDTVNYISSPSGIQTRVYVPLPRIKQKMNAKIGDKKITMNSALLQVDVTDIDSTTFAEPLIRYMLLVKDSSMISFFDKNELPNETYAILSQFSSVQNSTTLHYSYRYSFDIAKLIANELKINPNPTEDLKLRLVPVQVTSTTNSNTGATSYTAVKQKCEMGAVTIRNGKEVLNPVTGKEVSTPMRIKMIYSGF